MFRLSKTKRVSVDLSKFSPGKDRKNKEIFAVIGGGVCGVASVGKLVQEGYRVLWVDPEFRLGRMGKFWENVPTSTNIQTFVGEFEKLSVFNFQNRQERRRKLFSENKVERCPISDLPDRTKCDRLGFLLDTCQDAAEEFLRARCTTEGQ